MKDSNRSDDWRVLCELASKEEDPEKLIELIVKIDNALEERNHKSRYHETEIQVQTISLSGESAPIDANAHSYSVAPQLSLPAEYDC